MRRDSPTLSWTRITTIHIVHIRFFLPSEYQTQDHSTSSVKRESEGRQHLAHEEVICTGKEEDTSPPVKPLKHGGEQLTTPHEDVRLLES